MVKKAIRRNPVYPRWYLPVLGHANMVNGNWEEACYTYERYLKVKEIGFGTRVNLVAVYHTLGLEEEAREMAELVLESQPGFSWGNWVDQTMPFKDPADQQRMVDLLEGSGLFT